MYCEAADLVCEIDCCHLVAFELSGLFVELVSHHLKVVLCSYYRVCSNGDMTLGAKSFGLHSLNSGSCEYGAVADFLCESEQTVECVSSLFSFCLAVAVDSDMSKLKAEHCLNSFLCKITDLIELTCSYEVFLNHPASAASKDLVKRKVGVDVLSIDSACRHELHLCVRSCHSFDHVDSASLLSREEFNNIKAKGDRHLNIARIGSTRSYRNSLIYTVFNNGRV